ncbi:MAG: Sec-independent protein translocase subunit TatA/TatB [Thermoleophilaceae bacterium]
MGLGPSPMEIAVIAIIALIVLGPNKLPEAAKSLGKGFREMRDSFQGAADDDDDELSFDHDNDDEDADDGESSEFDPTEAIAEQDDKAAEHDHEAEPEAAVEPSAEDHQKDAESSVPSASSSSIERE